MSVLVKGMEMPISCWRCPLCLTVDPDTYRCIPTGQEFESTFDAIDHIVRPCPLVEVPPHGDLIDRSALEKDTEWSEYEDDFTSYSDACIRYAPVIIPAEGENK